MSDDLLTEITDDDGQARVESAARPSAAAPSEPARQLRPDPLFHWVLLLVSSAIIALSVVLSVRSETQVLLPVLGTPLPDLCMFKRMTGLGCPGCGMTRSFISLGHGDLAMAFSYNPAGLWFYAIILFQIPFRAAQLWRIRRGLPELRMFWLAQISLAILAILMVGQWILRLTGVEF
jgi:hypothetical protein